jgi:hypothetical protein
MKLRRGLFAVAKYGRLTKVNDFFKLTNFRDEIDEKSTQRLNFRYFDLILGPRNPKMILQKTCRRVDNKLFFCEKLFIYMSEKYE